MSLNNFIPSIWSARLLANTNKNLVYGGPMVVNRDYEGEISAQGDTVRINGIGRVTVSTYTKGTDHSAPEELQDAATTLSITESKMYNFAIDDVDKAQGNIAVMDAAMGEAGYALANTTDQFIAALYTDAANLIGSTASPKTDLGTIGAVYDYLVDLGVLLDENDVPQDNRYAIVPPWVHGLLLKDERFVSFGTDPNKPTLLKGQIGEAAGFSIMKSNNVPNTTATKYRIMAGHPKAITFADQLVKTEAYRPQLRFADAVKGLHLYGARVVRPSYLAVLTANKPA